MTSMLTYYPPKARLSADVVGLFQRRLIRFGQPFYYPQPVPSSASSSIDCDCGVQLVSGDVKLIRTGYLRP
jgi:hypothetical protein